MTLIELAEQVGLKPKRVANTAGGEYHCSCPVCGGVDRFYIQPNKQMKTCKGYYSCRKCGIYGDAIQFARDFLGQSFSEAAQAVNATITPTILSHAGFNAIGTKPIIDSGKPITLRAPSHIWIASATHFVHQTHELLLYQHSILEFLACRGLPIDAVKRYKLGWSDKDQYLHKKDWGLDDQLGKDEKQHMVWIPKGLVIPTTEPNGDVIRIKVRRYDWKEGDEYPKYIAISGSTNGLSIIGSQKHSAVIIIESELDAYAAHYAVGDVACIIAIGGSMKHRDNVTDAIAQKAPILLICHDTDEAGNKMCTKWQQLYPHAQAYPTPYGKDIGEAAASGLDIREFFLEAINPTQKENINTVESMNLNSHVPVVYTASSTRTNTITQQSTESVIPSLISSDMKQASDSDICVTVKDNAAIPGLVDKVVRSANTSNTEWPLQDRELITWAQQYFQAIPENAKLPSDKRLPKEIALGPNSERAQSGALQKELRWIRKLVSGSII